MISPQEIRNQALKWWKSFLQSYLKRENIFPKTIDRIGKISSSSVREKINQLQFQLEELQNNSKEKLGYGYVINRENVNFRRTGIHSLPQSITFESAEDYIDFIGKRKDWNIFLKSSNLIHQEAPQLSEWVFNNPLSVIENNKIWTDLIKVCNYFLLNPKPDLYIRQLPIDLHTKFVEQNDGIIKSLLDYLIPEYRRAEFEKSLSKRYYLKYDEPTIRIRILDKELLINNLSDLRMPLTDFENLNFNCCNILIAENKMNFLCLPELPSTIAIWSGGGFMISYLRDIKWLNKKNIFYWGDLDTHGFVILHQMRSYFSHTKSVMMDINTFELFKGEGLVSGEIVNIEILSTLNTSEMETFIFLKENNLRLEQEKIRQDYADFFFKKLISNLIIDSSIYK